jgi:hypothetical protein
MRKRVLIVLMMFFTFTGSALAVVDCSCYVNADIKGEGPSTYFGLGAGNEDYSTSVTQGRTVPQILITLLSVTWPVLKQTRVVTTRLWDVKQVCTIMAVSRTSLLELTPVTVI